MVNNEKNTCNTCPYCKEEIKPEAIKCKHCSSKLGKATPSHEGVCPFCKESIKPDAIKCKHCKTSLATDSDCGCDNVNGSEQVMALRINRRNRGGMKDQYCFGGTKTCVDEYGNFFECCLSSFKFRSFYAQAKLQNN